MLPEDNRLRLKKDHDKVFKKGLRYKSPLFLLVYLSRHDQLPSRFSFIISKKVAKSAVLRNRVRRQLREAIRLNLGRIDRGYDCVFIINTNILGIKTKEISLIVEEVLRNINILSN